MFLISFPIIVSLSRLLSTCSMVKISNKIDKWQTFYLLIKLKKRFVSIIYSNLQSKLIINSRNILRFLWLISCLSLNLCYMYRNIQNSGSMCRLESSFSLFIINIPCFTLVDNRAIPFIFSSLETTYFTIFFLRWTRLNSLRNRGNACELLIISEITLKQGTFFPKQLGRKISFKF